MKSENDRQDITSKFESRIEVKNEEGLEQYMKEYPDWQYMGAEPFQLSNGMSSLLTITYMLQRLEPYSSFFIKTQPRDA